MTHLKCYHTTRGQTDYYCNLSVIVSDRNIYIYNNNNFFIGQCLCSATGMLVTRSHIKNSFNGAVQFYLHNVNVYIHVNFNNVSFFPDQCQIMANVVSN